jgi:hypothetical protein
MVTYEDPRYEFAGDLQMRTNARKSTLVPIGSVLEASYQVSQGTGEPVNVVDTIQRIVEAKNLNPVGGRFEVYPSGDVLHIVPTEVRDSKGNWIKQQSVLSVPITFASEELGSYQLIEALLKEVSATSGQDIRGPNWQGLYDPFAGHKGKVEARDEPAREVLMRVLHSISPRYTYWASYDPARHLYYFTVVLTAAPAPALPERLSMETPRPGNPTPGGPPFRPRND